MNNSAENREDAFEIKEKVEGGLVPTSTGVATGVASGVASGAPAEREGGEREREREQPLEGDGGDYEERRSLDGMRGVEGRAEMRRTRSGRGAGGVGGAAAYGECKAGEGMDGVDGGLGGGVDLTKVEGMEEGEVGSFCPLTNHHTTYPGVQP